MTSPWTSLWGLRSDLTYLNHGSFGACPLAVRASQDQWRERSERHPYQFYARDRERLLDHARAALGAFVAADPDDLAFVANITTGVTAVVRSLPLAAGDELLTTDHAYDGTRNALDVAAAAVGARVVAAPVPFPCRSPDEVVAAVLAHLTARTRLAVVDHITSPTALAFPAAALVQALQGRGVDVLVDGAHAPGQIPLALDQLGAAYYVGTCHKWICTPKTCAFLHVRRDRQDHIRPAVAGKGIGSPRRDRSRFRLEFDWVATHDPTPALCLPDAIAHLGAQVPGGWPALMARNHDLALAARDTLCAALGVAPPCPPEMVGAMATIPLPDGAPGSGATEDPAQTALLDQHQIDVPILSWPTPPRRLLRVCAQLYNTIEQYQRVAELLPPLLVA